MPFALVPFLLLAIPLLEIAAFIVIGGQIGVLATLGFIFLTAVIGSILLRVQGFGLLTRIQTEMRSDRVPAREMVHGVMILIAGVLLLTPGFITDTLGFLLFVPSLRDAGWKLLRERISVVSMTPGGFPGRNESRSGEGVVDLDPDDYVSQPSDDSPWKPGSRK